MDASLSPASLPKPRFNPAGFNPMVDNQAGRAKVIRAEIDESRVPAPVRAKIRNAANEFEAQFLGQMLSPMFDSVPVDQGFGGGSGEEMFRSLLVNEYGKKMAQRGGIGLADQVYRELMRAQEASHG